MSGEFDNIVILNKNHKFLSMRWTEIGFGKKHPDKTLPQILLSDPDYFFWGMDTGAFEQRAHLRKQSEILNRRARGIKIPNNDDGQLEIEHIISPVNYTYARFDVESMDTPVHRGGSPALREKFLDLSFPRSLKQYDKSGGKLLIHSFKQHILGNSKARITKKVAEDFFSNPDNFIDP